ncbi:MAG: hypothetical protein OXC61_03795 [Flavobacteriaceae bacterium]|nr:hypothetical protein [Flavobacteriaceae bacterium]
MNLDNLESFDKKEFLNQVNNYKKLISNSSFIQEDLVALLTEQSTKIEGSTLTRKEVALLQKYGKPSGKPVEHDQMVKNHINALYKVINFCRFKTSIEIPMIEEVNKILLNKINNLGMIESGRVVNRSSGKIRDYQVEWEFNKNAKHEFIHYSEVISQLSKILVENNAKCR